MRLRLRGLNQKKKEKKINLHSTTLRRFATKITRTKTQKHSPSLAFPPFSRPGLGPAAPDFGPTVARASEEPATSPPKRLPAPHSPPPAPLKTRTTSSSEQTFLCVSE